MARDVSQDVIDSVRTAIAAGNKIEAIKLYREASGAGLADAKRFVEDLEAGRTPGAPPGESVTNDDIDQIQAALFRGDRIQAIKLYRTSTGEGLKESRDFILAVEAELRRTDPGKFTAPPAKGCGMMAACLLIVVATLVTIALS
jgi:ribosomal protein L7/L12